MHPSPDRKTLAKEPTLKTEEIARHAARSALDRKALDVVVLDVRGRTGYADYLVIASGTSDRHVQSIAELIAQEAKQAGIPVVGTEGAREGQWALIDLGPVVAHVFHEYTREVYNLESLHKNAARLALTSDAEVKTKPATKAAAKPRAKPKAETKSDTKPKVAPTKRRRS